MPELALALTPEIEQHLAALRLKKELKPIGPELEGSPLGMFPDNIFGFTSSPLNASTPLFIKRIFQSFEVHKLTEGVVHLLGFVTDKEAALVFESSQPVDVNLYPEPRGESSRLVEIPLERIARAKPLTRSDGNYMTVHLETA